MWVEVKRSMVQYDEFNESFYCRLNGELEKSLSLLNKIKDEKLKLYQQYIKARNNEDITKLKSIFILMQQLDYEQKIAEEKKNKAILQRIENKKINSQPNKLRKIDGISIKTFRELTKVLFDSKLTKRCEKCGGYGKLTIHHKRYKYPIELKDLQRLCRSCHSKLHKNTLTPSLHMEKEN
jgi:hypothetical protein